MDERSKRVEHIKSVLLSDRRENYLKAMTVATALIACTGSTCNKALEDTFSQNMVQHAIFMHVTSDVKEAEIIEANVMKLLDRVVDKIVAAEENTGGKYEDNKLYDAAKSAITGIFGDIWADKKPGNVSRMQ